MSEGDHSDECECEGCKSNYDTITPQRDWKDVVSAEVDEVMTQIRNLKPGVDGYLVSKKLIQSLSVTHQIEFLLLQIYLKR